MDTTTDIMMRILEDFYSRSDNQMKGEYSMYYESLDREQSRIVVSDAIRKITSNNPEVKCEFGEDTFTLTAD